MTNHHGSIDNKVSNPSFLQKDRNSIEIIRHTERTECVASKMKSAVHFLSLFTATYLHIVHIGPTDPCKHQRNSFRLRLRLPNPCKTGNEKVTCMDLKLYEQRTPGKGDQGIPVETIFTRTHPSVTFSGNGKFSYLCSLRGNGQVTYAFHPAEDMSIAL